MNYQNKHTILCLTLILTTFFVFAYAASAQTTAFNYQGRLNDGTNPANGRYDLEFRLYDALTGDNIIGTAISKPNLTLINGVFSTQLDFGLTAFNGADRFIEIRLRQTATGSNPPNAFVILGPRQQILSVPYTIRSSRATLADDATHAVNADNAIYAISATNSQNAVNSQNATNAQTAINSQQLGSLPANRYLATDANGNLNLGNGSVSFGGSVTQTLAANGLPKAILRLDRDGNITSCYNAVTGASTGNCGFSVTHNEGQYRVAFGFNVSNRVINLTTEYDDGHTVAVINERNSSDILIFVYYSESGNGSSGRTNSPVNIVVF